MTNPTTRHCDVCEKDIFNMRRHERSKVHIKRQKKQIMKKAIMEGDIPVDESKIDMIVRKQNEIDIKITDIQMMLNKILLNI